MSQAITKEQFIEFGRNSEEALTYVLMRMQLKNNYLVGTVRSIKLDRNFLIIDHLVNPYTGLKIIDELFENHSVRLSVYCRVNDAEFPLKEGDRVLFSFMVNTYRDVIEKGDLLRTSVNDLIPIEDASDVLRELDLKIDDLEIIGLVKGEFYDEHGKNFIDFVKENVQKKIEHSKKELEAKEKAHKEFEQQLADDKQKLQQEQQQLAQQKEVLKDLGFTFDTQIQSENIINEDLSIKDPSSIIDEIQSQLAARGFFYEEDLLRQILSVLKTGQMLTLVGPSGTGKTTIISELAKIIGAKHEIIPIQPSWTDKQDLLGYYNPIRQLYVPTAFLDCLIEAKKNKNQLYLICLDEMNLAQIEYYLADVLSVREIEGETLRLYSDYERQQNMEEIAWFTQKSLQLSNQGAIDELITEKLKITTLEQYRFAQRYQNMQRYQSKIEIPGNVRIIGTMNIDGTVQPLSPKVVDRSFVLPMNRQDAGEIREVELCNYHLPAAYFELDRNEEKELDDTLQQDLLVLRQQLAVLGVDYNHRVEKHIKQYVQATDKFEVDPKKLLDELVFMKVLPRIHHYPDQNKPVHTLFEVEKETGADSKSAGILREMLEKYSATRVFSYWS